MVPEVYSIGFFGREGEGGEVGRWSGVGERKTNIGGTKELVSLLLKPSLWGHSPLLSSLSAPHHTHAHTHTHFRH